MLGDFDGDGRFDLAVGAGNGDRVRVHYTRAHPHGSHVAFITGHAQHAGNTGFGWALAIGDFNGDGFSDLAVGAPLFQRPASPATPGRRARCSSSTAARPGCTSGRWR